MAQHGFTMGGHGGNAIDPNDLAMYETNYSGHNNPSAYSSGAALFGDDELLDGLSGPPGDSGIQSHGQDFGGMNDISMGYPAGFHHGLPVEQPHVNGFSSTPDGDPIQSPYVHGHGYSAYRIQQTQPFGGALQSPLSYAGSPLAGSDLNTDSNDQGFHRGKTLSHSHAAQRGKPGSTGRGPLTPKTAAMPSLSMNSDSGFGAQPIRSGGGHHEKTHSGQWMQTPNSVSSFPGSGYSSPLQAGLHSAQINDIILKQGTSMPAKLGATSTAVSSQEAKRKRRRESHNLVERRRRDNINERIQDLSKLVPAHRLEDEKIRKAIQNGTPLSPSLGAISSPTQATSALAGPGARRAAAGNAGNITTGLPIEEKDKGPNKGDILNGAVSWTRDLMWMLHLKLQQQEELINALLERGGSVPFEFTDDERRMQTELVDAMVRIDREEPKSFSYTRTAGSGLRVPHHTDYKGEPVKGNGLSVDHISVSPDGDGTSGVGGDGLDPVDFLDYDDEGDGGMDFKEEDEYMDMTQ